MKIITYLVLIPIMVYSCKQVTGFKEDKQAILELHEAQRKAHFKKDIAFFAHHSNTEDFIEVNRGLVRKPKPSEIAVRFENYFNSVDFIKWDDVTNPIISFSDDGTMATVVVDKLVVVRELATNKIDSVKYAWLSVYKKQNGQWLMHRMGSTNN